MEYAEFWILETAVDMGVSFCCLLGPPDRMTALWNKPYHHLSRPAMLNLLERLARDGDIIAKDDGDSAFTPDRQQIDAWISNERPGRVKHWYQLTPQGGERWESFSNADWDRYHLFEPDRDDDGFREIAATTPEFAERTYRYHLLLGPLRVFPETVERRILHPWSATYWKTLQIGYSVRFKCEYIQYYREANAHLFPGMPHSEFLKLVVQNWGEAKYIHTWYERHPETPCMGQS